MRSDEALLARHVAAALSKAQTKLSHIREQIEQHRKYAADRSELLTKAEAKLSAAIAAVQTPTQPKSSDGRLL